ncbi:MAG TPA: DUF349 domain-containing protein [Propionibacteriaceae bacterium]|nr:DUF349 domain-containing protein [Propionibacteriaceae bacterium]HPZ50469.1 DUF349 domain-containing protein [Propionibacteriaceae bacterium]HQE31262.1 DUF349 domain-containing protein [Propionibacteriaceae bacterium]
MTEAAGPAAFGRVDDDGTVHVRTAEGERTVGQIPDSTPEEALAFFVRRFEALEVEVGLLETRLKKRALSPDDARRSIATLRGNFTEANAVGDLDGLIARLDALTPVLAEAQEARRAERAKAHEATKAAKEAMVAEAEKLAAGTDWRGGVNRFRTLLDEWKALPRIDRTTDDELWHRFSGARTTYTRRRKTEMAVQGDKRDAAKQAKEAIIADARALADTTEWGAAAGGFRDLMTRWKAAGVAPRAVDDKLWAEFRGIQDAFFARRTQAFAEQDAEFSGNLEAKVALLDAAEKSILPVKDPKQARAEFRTFLQKFNEFGKVPRDQIRTIDNRVRAIEEAVRAAEDAEWKRTDPETLERASGTANLLADQIAKLTDQLAKAQAKGDKKAAAQAEASIATYQSWLDQANATLKDFTG